MLGLMGSCVFSLFSLLRIMNPCSEVDSLMKVSNAQVMNIASIVRSLSHLW